LYPVDALRLWLFFLRTSTVHCQKSKTKVATTRTSNQNFKTTHFTKKDRKMMHTYSDSISPTMIDHRNGAIYPTEYPQDELYTHEEQEELIYTQEEEEELYRQEEQEQDELCELYAQEDKMYSQEDLYSLKEEEK